MTAPHPATLTRAQRYPAGVQHLRRFATSICVDDDCDLSYGDAHAGACVACTCGQRHAAAECAAFREGWQELAARELRTGAARTALARQRPQVVVEGAYLCRWCDKPCPGQRTSYCSDDCKHEFRLRAEPSYLRSAVFHRDGGACALCSVNPTLAHVEHSEVARQLRDQHRAAEVAFLRGRRRHLLQPEVATALDRLYAQHRADNDQLRALWDALGMDRYRGSSRQLWDADHVVPVVEGGENALANLRTLCVPCHRTVTAALHRRLAVRRAATPQLVFPGGR